MFKSLLLFSILLAVIILSECEEGSKVCTSQTLPCTGFCSVGGQEKPCVENENGQCHCPASNSNKCKAPPGAPGGEPLACTDYRCTNVDGVKVSCRNPTLHPIFSLTRENKEGECSCPSTCSDNDVATCSAGATCPSDKSCDRGIGGNKCACRGNKGSTCDPCKGDQQCVEGTVCRPNLVDGIWENQCVPSGVNEPCNCNDPTSCRGQLECQPIVPTPPQGQPCGICKRPLQDLNQVCDIKKNDCKAGLTCIPSSTTPGSKEGTCKKDPGQPCTPGSTMECSSVQCTGGTCQPISPNGVCNPKVPDQCTTGYTCKDTNNNDRGTCQPKPFKI